MKYKLTKNDAALIARLLREEAGALIEDALVDERHNDIEAAEIGRASASHILILVQVFESPDVEVEIER